MLAAAVKNKLIAHYFVRVTAKTNTGRTNTGTWERIGQHLGTCRLVTFVWITVLSHTSIRYYC